jgi:hypothetical protein
MLFHIRGNIDIKATLVSNIIPAIPLKKMQVVLTSLVQLAPVNLQILFK